MSASDEVLLYGPTESSLVGPAAVIVTWGSPANRGRWS